MPRDRSRSPVGRRRRSISPRDRADRGDRRMYDRDRGSRGAGGSGYRDSRPPPPRRRERSRSRERYGGGRYNRERSRSRSPLSRRRSRSPKPKPPPRISAAAIVNSKERTQIVDDKDTPQPESEDDKAMMKAMGFCGFNTTKNKQKFGAVNAHGINIQQKRKYRQYMNRKGGFNRPLDPVA